jgi:hypothetical protein
LIGLLFGSAAWAPARAGNELVTVPVVVADYYGWAYTEMFMDRADVFGWCNAGSDSLGWGLLVFANDYDAGLKFVNLAGMAKTVYPLAALLGAKDPAIHERAWITLGTHTLTLFTLEVLGKPALTVQTFGPRRDAYGAALAFRF